MLWKDTLNINFFIYVSFFLFLLYNILSKAIYVPYITIFISVRLNILEMEFSNWFWKSSKKIDFFVCVWIRLLRTYKCCTFPLIFQKNWVTSGKMKIYKLNFTNMKLTVGTEKWLSWFSKQGQKLAPRCVYEVIRAVVTMCSIRMNFKSDLWMTVSQNVKWIFSN